MSRRNRDGTRTFPQDEGGLAETDGSSEDDLRLRAIRAVIADDHAPTRFLIRTLFEYSKELQIVGEAEDGEQALELVATTSPDVVLLDVQMPRLDGPTAAEMIRMFRPQIRVVLHSAHADTTTRASAAMLGVPLIDKMRFDDVVALLEAEPSVGTTGEVPDTLVERATSRALTSYGGQTPLVVATSDGRIAFYNIAAARLIGLPAPPAPGTLEELRSRRSQDDGSTTPEWQRVLQRAIVSGKAADEIVELASGIPHTPIRCVAVPFFGHEGNPRGATLSLHPL